MATWSRHEGDDSEQNEPSLLPRTSTHPSDCPRGSLQHCYIYQRFPLVEFLGSEACPTLHSIHLWHKWELIREPCYFGEFPPLNIKLWSVSNSPTISCFFTFMLRKEDLRHRMTSLTTGPWSELPWLTHDSCQQTWQWDSLCTDWQFAHRKNSGDKTSLSGSSGW